MFACMQGTVVAPPFEERLSKSPDGETKHIYIILDAEDSTEAPPEVQGLCNAFARVDLENPHESSNDNAAHPTMANTASTSSGESSVLLVDAATASPTRAAACDAHAKDGKAADGSSETKCRNGEGTAGLACQVERGKFKEKLG